MIRGSTLDFYEIAIEQDLIISVGQQVIVDINTFAVTLVTHTNLFRRTSYISNKNEQQYYKRNKTKKNRKNKSDCTQTRNKKLLKKNNCLLFIKKKYNSIF